MRWVTSVFLAVSACAVFAQTGLIPLNDLGAHSYRGSQGGLYPGGSNTMPIKHLKYGNYETQFVVPLNGAGDPSPDGKIGLLTIGMSNTNQESTAWGNLLRADPAVNPKVVFVNGAQGGQTAYIISDEFGRGAQFWATVDTRVAQAGLTKVQVQAIWLKEADASPTNGWPAYATNLENEMILICQIMRRRFPNARLCYLSSRTYGGYATTQLNPEPYAYESGFSVKWLIEAQINGDQRLFFGGPEAESIPSSPWLCWGPYLWADGIKPRSDGLVWLRSDFGTDGTHPSTQGANKVAQMLMQFFKTDYTARQWFLRSP